MLGRGVHGIYLDHPASGSGCYLSPALDLPVHLCGTDLRLALVQCPRFPTEQQDHIRLRKHSADLAQGRRPVNRQPVAPRIDDHVEPATLDEQEPGAALSTPASCTAQEVISEDDTQFDQGHRR